VISFLLLELPLPLENKEKRMPWLKPLKILKFQFKKNSLPLKINKNKWKKLVK